MVNMVTVRGSAIGLDILDSGNDDGAIPPRSRRGDQPIEHDRMPVKIRGEELGKVLWRGRQWAVTDLGIECLDGTYYIAASRIGEDLAKGWGWPQHLCEKSWVDTEDFLTAWLVAIALHGIPLGKCGVLDNFMAAKLAREAIARSHPARNGQ